MFFGAELAISAFLWFFKNSSVFLRVPGREFSVCRFTNAITSAACLTVGSMAPSAVMAWPMAMFRHSSVLHWPFSTWRIASTRRLCKVLVAGGNPGRPANRVTRRDHHETGNGSQVAVEDSLDAIVVINGRQVGDDLEGGPFDDVVLRFEQLCDRVEHGKERFGMRFAERDQRLRGLELLRARLGQGSNRRPQGRFIPAHF